MAAFTPMCVIPHSKLGIREREIIARKHSVVYEYDNEHELFHYMTEPDESGHSDGFVWDKTTSRVVG